MSFEQYIVGIIAVAVYLICFIFHEVKWINNRYLPLIAGVLGVAFNIWYSHAFTFDIFVAGLASGLSAVGVDQVIDQFKNKGE